MRNHEKENGADAPPAVKGVDFCKELQTTYDGFYKRKYPYHRGKYHQSIPNPDRPGEFLVVQLIDTKMYHGIDTEELFEKIEQPVDKDGKSLAQKYCQFEIMADQDDAYGSEMDSDEDDYGDSQESGDQDSEERSRRLSVRRESKK